MFVKEKERLVSWVSTIKIGAAIILKLTNWFWTIDLFVIVCLNLSTLRISHEFNFNNTDMANKYENK